MSLVSYKSKDHDIMVPPLMIRKRRAGLEHPPQAPQKSEKISALYFDYTHTYVELLNSPDLLTAKNLLTWAKDLVHLLTLLHEQNILLGKIEINEIGIKNGQLAIRHLNELVKKESLLQGQDVALTRAFMPSHLSFFGDLVSEKNDVRNLGIILFIFAHHQLHPKSVTIEIDYKKIIDIFVDMKDQEELDHYLDGTLLPKTSEDNLSSVIRDMLLTNGEARVSSEIAYHRLVGLCGEKS
jgi:hypothetical protein